MEKIRRQDSSIQMSTAKRHIFYTKIEKVNSMIIEFVRVCAKDCIWLSIEADGINNNCLNERFTDVLQMTLDIARSNCIETTSPQKRFIKIRTRDIQNKVFIKIEFSCGTQCVRQFDKNIVKLHELMEEADGYFYIGLEHKHGCIKMAIPK